MNAIAQCLAAQPILALPALMLIYAGIDGMAYVALPETYYIGPGGICLIPFHQRPHVAPVVVPLARLANAFHHAIDRFLEAIETDPELEKRVWSREQVL